MPIKHNNHKFYSNIINFFFSILGKENKKLNPIIFWTMLSTISTIVLLIIAYTQLKNVNETTSADFSHKIKNDLFIPNNIRLLTLFDDDILNFKTDSNNNEWFELDTVKYKKLPAAFRLDNIALSYNIIEIDEFLQDFEDLSFYEKRGQTNIDYIYDHYAYYIEMLWENEEIKKYVVFQRAIPHFSNTYINFENIYRRLKDRTDKEK
jgi:hypothetical protein